MFVCCKNESSVINLIYSGQQLFSYIDNNSQIYSIKHVHKRYYCTAPWVKGREREGKGEGGKEMMVYLIEGISSTLADDVRLFIFLSY